MIFLLTRCVDVGVCQPTNQPEIHGVFVFLPKLVTINHQPWRVWITGSSVSSSAILCYLYHIVSKSLPHNCLNSHITVLIVIEHSFPWNEKRRILYYNRILYMGIDSNPNSRFTTILCRCHLTNRYCSHDNPTSYCNSNTAILLMWLLLQCQFLHCPICKTNQ